MNEHHIASLLTRAEVAEHRAHEAEAELAALRRDLADERAAVARAERAQRKAERETQEARRLVATLAAKVERLEEEVAARGAEAHGDEDVVAEFVRRFDVGRVEFGDEHRSVAAHWGGSWESWGRGAAAVVDVGAVDAIIRAARLARGE